MIEPIYVVTVTNKEDVSVDIRSVEIVQSIEDANKYAETMARTYPGCEIHVCRTIRVIKAAKPELAPIQELTVGP